MKFAMYWASPFVPAIATLIILLAEGEEKRGCSDEYVSCFTQQTEAPCSADVAKPALPGTMTDESGRRLPRDIQAAHVCWGRDSVDLIRTTAEGQSPLNLDLETTCRIQNRASLLLATDYW